MVRLEVRPFRLFSKLPLYLLKLRLTADNKPGYCILIVIFYLAMATSIFLALYLTSTFVLASFGIHPDAPSKVCRAYRTIFPPENAASWLKQTAQSTKQKHADEIPKIIHQISLEGELSRETITRMSTWKNSNMEYQYKFWRRRDIKQLMTERYPQYLPLLDVVGDELLLAPFILHHHGGVVIDVRLECTGSLDEILSKGKCILARIPSLYSLILYQKDITVTSLFMASTPRHPFLEYILLLLPTQDTSKCPQERKRTAPVIQHLFKSYKTALGDMRTVPLGLDVETIPPKDPINWSEINKLLLQKAVTKCRRMKRLWFNLNTAETKKLPCDYLDNE